MNISQSLLKQPRMALVAAAVAVALAGSAHAQDANRENANRGPATETQIARGDTGMQTLDQYLKSKTLRASKLIGMELQHKNGDNLAEVRDIASSSGPAQKLQLVAALEGALGNDQKLIAIPADDAEISADGDELFIDSTREQLAAMPVIERGGNSSLTARLVGDLVGAEVVGSNGDKVGEIDDVVLSTAGADSARAVLQIGGVAGIGEKRISLPLNQLAVERAAGDEPTVRVMQDLASLERMPEFEYEDETTAL